MAIINVVTHAIKPEQLHHELGRHRRRLANSLFGQVRRAGEREILHQPPPDVGDLLLRSVVQVAE
jgi:hypothetical protein